MKRFILLSMVCAAMTGCADTQKQAAESKCSMEKDSLEIVMNLHRTVKPEYVSAYKKAFAKCKEATVKEEGCLDYGVYQSPEDSTEFLVHENWANEAALARHSQTPHLKQLLEETKEMISRQSNKKVYVLTQE